MVKLGIQLYTVRNDDQKFPEILEQIADAGFEGVELAYRFQDSDSTLIKETLDRLELQVISGHTNFHNLEDIEKSILDKYKELGCYRLVIPHLPRHHFRTIDGINNLGYRLNNLGLRLQKRGFQLYYHNQPHDFYPISRGAIPDYMFYQMPNKLSQIFPDNLTIPNRLNMIKNGPSWLRDYLYISYTHQNSSQPKFSETAFSQLISVLEPGIVGIELDVGAVMTAGYNPVEVHKSVTKAGLSVPQIHLKDVEVLKPNPLATQNSVQPGSGIVNFDSVIRNGINEGVDWFIFEHDNPDNPLETMEKGARFFKPLCQNAMNKPSL